VMLLPAGWTQAKLGEVADVVAGQAPPGTSYNADGHGLPLYQGKTDFGSVLLRPPRVWTTRPARLAEADDVLVSVRAPVGPTNMASAACAIGRGLAAVRGRQGMNQRYLLYAIRASAERLQAMATGTTFSAITTSVLRDHVVPVAPAAEQDRIVEAIEEQFSRLDAAISALERARGSIARMRTSIFHSALGAQMESGPRAPLSSVAQAQLGRMLSAKRETGRYARPYLRNRDVQWGRISTEKLPVMDFSNRDSERFRLLPGDVLICEGGEIGRAAVWTGQLSECYYQKALHRVRCSPHLDPYYLRYVLEYFSFTKQFERFQSGSTIAHLPQEDLRQLPIPVPPAAEQRATVYRIEQLLSAVERAADNIEVLRARSDRFHSSVLCAAFAGKLVRQDPMEEPASTLLERVGGERASGNTQKTFSKRPRVEMRA
jgi:type I restriction enzyme, S subunit